MGKKNLKKVPDNLNSNLIRDDVSEASSNSAFWSKGYAKSEEERESDEDNSEFAKIDENLEDIMGDLSNKNITTRLPALKNLKKIMQANYIPEIVDDKKISLLSILERCAKRDQYIEERTLACDCIALFFLQTAYFSNDSDQFWEQMEQCLGNLFKFDSVNLQVRESALFAHSFIAFILQSREDASALTAHMDTLEALFKRATPKKRNVHTQLSAKGREVFSVVPLHTESEDLLSERINSFRATALKSWTLLLTICPGNVATAKIESLIAYIIGDILRDTTTPLPVRMAAAECLAVCNELDPEAFARTTDPKKSTENVNEVSANLKSSNVNTLAEDSIELLESLVAENPKYTSKRDQRSSRGLFRRVLHSFLASHPPKTVHPLSSLSRTYQSFSESNVKPENTASAKTLSLNKAISNEDITSTTRGVISEDLTSFPGGSTVEITSQPQLKGILKLATSNLDTQSNSSTIDCANNNKVLIDNEISTNPEHVENLSQDVNNLTLIGHQSDNKILLPDKIISEKHSETTTKKSASFDPEVVFSTPERDEQFIDPSFLGVGTARHEPFKTELIKFGLTESLVVNSWVVAIRYESFSSILGHGTNLHLRENDLLRQIFNLGPALPASQQSAQKLTREDKQARDVKLNYVRKHRTQSMQKARKFKDQSRSALLIADD